MKMKELPKWQTPDEKCLRYGSSALSDAELLSMIIRNGTRGNNVLMVCESVLQLSAPGDGLVGLVNLGYEELCSVRGIGKTKALQLMSIGELSKRISKRSRSLGRPVFQSAEQIAEFYMEDLRHLTYECVMILMVDCKMHLIRETVISKGSVNATVISPREIYIEALRVQAAAVILLHNHPSGNPTPSQEDVLFTQRIKQSGELLGINLLDHLVIGDNRYYSFLEQGLL